MSTEPDKSNPPTPSISEAIHEEAVNADDYDAAYEVAKRLARTLRILSVGGFVTEEKINQAWELVK